MEKNQTRSKSRDVALAAMLAVLYAADVVFFAPISFQTIQVRVADALLPLSILFGPSAVIGLGFGVIAGNLFAIPFGAIAFEIFVITFIVGSYLALLTSTPLLFSLFYVMAGEILAVGVGGYLLLNAVNRTLKRSSS